MLSIGSWCSSRFSSSYLLLKLARVAQARLADVDGRDAGFGLAQRVAGGLRRAAAGDQDLPIARALSVGQMQMEQRAATLRVAVEIAMLVEAGERRRIRHPLVEVADRFAPVHVARSACVAVVQPCAPRQFFTQTGYAGASAPARAPGIVGRGIPTIVGRISWAPSPAPAPRPG